MKKLFLTISFLLTTIVVSAQTIHWITFIDTNDRNVGQIDVLGRQVLYSHFINEVNAALAPKGYKAVIHDFYGDKTTPENCKAAVELLRVDPRDIIVFYYIGHGGRPNTDPGYMAKHPYPQMCMQLKFPESKYIPLEWVHNKLSSKGARLSVTIGMCCNSLSNISIKEEPKFAPNYGATYMSASKQACIQDLFLNVKGSVLATSASPTQTSGCFNSQFGVIDRYTTILCLIFDNALDQLNGKLSWDNLLNEMRSVIHEKTNGQQTPIHETHLTAAPAPQPTKPNVPSEQNVRKTQQQQVQQQTQQKGLGGEWINDLTGYFDALISTSLSESERIESEKNLRSLFAQGAQVRILGQDSDNSIDREDADVFLGRLATSRILLKVMVVDGTFDANNRIKSLKVREIYKK